MKNRMIISILDTSVSPHHRSLVFLSPLLFFYHILFHIFDTLSSSQHQHFSMFLSRDSLYFNYHLIFVSHILFSSTLHTSFLWVSHDVNQFDSSSLDHTLLFFSNNPLRFNPITSFLFGKRIIPT